MDATKDNVEMCLKAHEIQDQWKFTIGDYFTTPDMTASNHNPCIVDDFWLNDELTKRTLSNRMKSRDWIWLPRQDQLQDMLEDVFSNREIVPLTSKLHDVCVHLIQEHNFGGRTMEQLWLAFVMHEKYEKVWSYAHLSWLNNEE